MRLQRFTYIFRSYEIVKAWVHECHPQVMPLYCMCPTYLQDIMHEKTLNSHYIIYISLYGTVNCAVKLKFKGYVRK